MTQTTPAFTRCIADFVSTLDDALDDEALLETLKVRIVDTVGCMLGAADAEPVRIAREVAEAYQRPADGVPVATIAGGGALSLEAATFVNGIAARFLDFNDIYLSKEAVHPSDNIPVALALAEGLQRDGRELLLAVLKGYEVHCRLADTVSTRKGGWDNVVLGAIASSVMAGSLLRLAPEQQAAAISIAAIGNVALMETRAGSLSMWKAAAAPYAARAGVFAALHAGRGMTAPRSALDGKYGLFAQVTGPSDTAVFSRKNGAWRSHEVHLKAFPAQYFTQTAIEAALKLRVKLDGALPKRIEIRTFEFGRVAAADSKEKWRPETRETADHSMPYCVAVALLDGQVSEAQFVADRIRAEDVRALLPRIEVREDEALNSLYPEKVPTRISIELSDGRWLEEGVDYPLGHSHNPMSKIQVAAKFADLAPGKSALLDRLFEIEKLDRDALGAALAELS